MAGWAIAGIVFLLAAAAGGSKKKSNGGGGGNGEPAAPSLESIAAVICTLFMSTHAASLPTVTRADAWKVLGWNSAPTKPEGLAAWNSSLTFAERLYSGEIQCEDNPEDPEDEVPFAPGGVCSRSGTPYNAALFNSVLAVQNVLRYLGFQLPTEPTAAQYSKVVKAFQQIARGIGLPGHANVAAKYIDGVPGKCTLVDLGIAFGMARKGTWPYSLVTGLGSGSPPPVIIQAQLKGPFIPLRVPRKK